MVAILSPRRLRNLLDVTQPQGTGLPDQGVPLLHSSNSSFVIETVAGGGGGSFSLGASNLGNTLGQTGVTGTRVVLAGIGNLTLSQLTDGNGGTISISGGTAAAQSVQTQDRFNLTVAGNTAGALALVSSGVLTLAGGNSITLSQNGNAITISGPTTSQSVQPETQTFLGGISASDALYTSGTVRFTGVGGGVTVSSNTGQRVDISVAAPVAQTEQTQSRFNLTISGNTAGAGALVSSGVLTLAGGNNITVSQNGNAITLSGANVGGAQTGISGIIASDATYTSGTVQFTGSNMVTVRSSAGQRVVIDATQSVQTQNMIALSLSGNTAGALALVSSGTLTLAGGTNVTLSQAGNAVTILAGGGSGGDTDVTEITQTAHGLSVGDWVRLDGTDYVLAQADTETNAEVVGVVSVVDDANNFTLITGGLVTGLSGLTAGAVHYLDPSTPGAITDTEPSGVGEVSKPVLIARSTTSGYVFNMRGAVVPGDITAFLAGMSNIGNTAGDTGITGSRLVLAGGNNITLSQSTNASGGTVTISAPNQSVQPGIQQLVVSNTTFSSGTVSLSGFGDITVNTAANIIRISGTQTVQTQGILSAGVSNVGTTAGNTQVSTGSRLVIAGGGIVTASQATAAGASTITLSASQSVQTQNVHNVTLSGNTAGAMAHISSGTMTLAGGNNITLSQAGNAVTISGGAGGGFSAGLSTGGNTAGDTGVTGTRLVLVGSNNITMSQATDANGGTISIQGQSPAGGAFSAGASNLGNTAGATGISGTQMVLVGSGAMSLSQTTGANGNTVSILGPATSSLVGASGISISTDGSTISVMQTTGSSFRSSWQGWEGPGVTQQQGQQSIAIAPYRVPDLHMDRAIIGLHITNASNSSNSITISVSVGIYTRTASSLSLLSSIASSTNFTASGTVGSYSLYSGIRFMSIPLTMTLTEGDYYIAHLSRTTTGGGAGFTLAQFCRSEFTAANITVFAPFGTIPTSSQLRLGLGHYSATSTQLPGSIAFSQILGTNSVQVREPYIQLRNSTV